MRRVLLAIGIFGFWFASAYLLNGLAIELLVFAIMGGVYSPPAFWIAIHTFGMHILPPIFLFGGLPTAYNLLRGRDIKNTLLYSMIVFALAWIFVMATIFWLPGILGWYW